MSFSIATLLIRNLHDVFGVNDPAHRRAAIDEIFSEDCVFYEPRGVHRGNGYRAALVRRQLTPGLTSSLPGTAGLPPFISFSTSYAERSLQQHHESLGTTSAIRRSICSASSKTGLSRMSSAPPSATSRSPRTQASGGP